MQPETEYLEATTLQLDLWGDHFGLLEHRLKTRAPAGRAELALRIEALRRRKRTLKRSLREATYADGNPSYDRAEIEEAVEEFRSNAVAVYDDVRRAL